MNLAALTPKFRKFLPWGLALSTGTALYSVPEASDKAEADPIERGLLDAYRLGSEAMTPPRDAGFKFGGAKTPTSIKTAGLGLGKAIGGGMKSIGDLLSQPKNIGAIAAGGAALGIGAAAADPLYDMAQPFIEAKGYELARDNTDIWTRAKMDQVAAESFAKTLGSEAATGLTSLLGAGADVAQAPRSSHYNDLFGHLVDTDPIIGMATPEQQQLLGSAYQSMQKVAPTIAADPFATKNFLREVMVTNNGPDHATLGNLAKSEESIRGRGRR